MQIQIGSELNSDPGFDTSTGWNTHSSAWSINFGRAVANGALNGKLTRTSAETLTEGLMVHTHVEVTALTEGAIAILVGGNQGTTITAPGTYVEDIESGGADQLIGMLQIGLDGAAAVVEMLEMNPHL